MIVHEKTGGRTVHLFIPFEHNKQTIETITFAPLRLGHALRWGKGGFKDSMELLVDLAGVDQSIINNVRFPDATRVMDCFMEMLTPEIRDDIINNRIPLKPETDTEYLESLPHATNGGGEPMVTAPGVPLPQFDPQQPGFDLSEEP
jgi:hypothetical protein